MSLLALLLLLLAAAVSLAGAGDDHPSCPGALSMTVESACRKASHTQATYQMCRDALREIPYPTSDAHDATVYALAAARRALASADATMDAAIKLLTYNHSLTGGEREAYSECVEAYTTAEHAVGRVISRLAACGFDGALAGDYMDGLIDVESCRDRVLRLTASPIYALVLVDRNRFGLALFLGKLLGI